MKHLMNNLVKTSIGLGVVALGIFYAGKKQESCKMSPNLMTNIILNVGENKGVRTIKKAK